MRALLLVALLALPAFAGCFGGAERQWAGVVNAYQYSASSIVEIQLHSTRVNQAGNAATAHAAMVALDRVEDAVADLRMPNGTTVSVPISGWTFDRLNDTIVAPMAATGYDAFHMNATFVLKNGTVLRTHEPVRWHEEFARPYYGVMDVKESSDGALLTLSVYRVRENATYFEYLGEGPEGTLSSANISAVEAWSVRVKGANGTEFTETAQPTAGATKLSVSLPYRDIVEAEARFSLRLKDGSLITERDVDRDVYPIALAESRQRAQQN
jgi:hypothetical protein